MMQGTASQMCSVKACFLPPPTTTSLYPHTHVITEASVRNCISPFSSEMSFMVFMATFLPLYSPSHTSVGSAVVMGYVHTGLQVPFPLYAPPPHTHTHTATIPFPASGNLESQTCKIRRHTALLLRSFPLPSLLDHMSCCNNK